MTTLSSRRLRNLLVAAAAALLTATVTAPAAAWTPPPFASTHTVRAAHSDKCLGPQNDSTQAGARIVQQPCDGRPSQKVTLITARGDIPADSFFFRTSAGLCWNVEGALHHQGTPIIQWPCSKALNEVFTAYGDRHPWAGHVLRTHTTRPKYWNCLHVQDASTADGAALIQHPCNLSGQGAHNDTFLLTPA
ncbi:RICIN domain-containing protein [Streptomyces sp. NPDC015492]|uniref:RICIN domain-containing protein n=1 Tax=Streptomyces sp. NPDC015492 TaxID=3364958 RepID=UPI0036FA58E0